MTISRERLIKACKFVPPMMGLEDELVSLKGFNSAENDGFVSHYTALLNGKRVWLFDIKSEDRWFVAVTSPGVSSHKEFRQEYKSYDSYFRGSPLELLAHLHHITSGGNDASIRSKYGNSRHYLWG